MILAAPLAEHETACSDLASMGKRFVDAWHRAQAGETVDEAHVTFLSFQAMTETLSPRRL